MDRLGNYRAAKIAAWMAVIPVPVPAYLIWLAVNVPFFLAVNGLWGTDWWASIAPRLMGV